LVKLVGRVPLLWRLLVILAVPVIFLLAATGVLTSDYRVQVAEKAAFQKAQVLDELATHLMVDLASERGISAMIMQPAVCAQLDTFCSLALLAEARGKMDATLHSFLKTRQDNPFISSKENLTPQYKATVAYLEFSMGELRGRVDRNKDNDEVNSVRKTYTSMIFSIIDFIAEVSRTVTSPEVSYRMRVFSELLRGQQLLLSGHGEMVQSFGTTNRTTHTELLTNANGYLASMRTVLTMIMDTAPEDHKDMQDTIRKFLSSDDLDQAMSYLSTTNEELMASQPAERKKMFELMTKLGKDLLSISMDQLDVLARAKDSINQSYRALIVCGIVATVFTCTFLLGALVASIRYEKAKLVKSILTARQTDKQIRKLCPNRFMNLLDITNPTQLLPGMHADLNVTLLFADLRGFSAAAETMTHSELYNILLDYTKIVNPIIGARGGFVDKWVGDGVFAVFQDPEEAVFAAVELQHAVKVLNGERAKAMATTPALTEVKISFADGSAGSSPHQPASEELAIPGLVGHSHQLDSHAEENGGAKEVETTPLAGRRRASTVSASSFGIPTFKLSGIEDCRSSAAAASTKSKAAAFKYRVGIGIHTGSVVAGVLGNGERIDCTMVGDAVNVSARLEALCGRLGAEILISDATRSRLSAPGAILHRSLGEIQMPGRQQAVEVWEVYETNDEPVRSIKSKTAESLVKASRAFSDPAGPGTASAIAMIESELPRANVTVSDPVALSTMEMMRKMAYKEKEV
jgi:class 3 adenylate cyclase